ncbi:MAG: prepilin-type N-terminal cleavage/methylation domain-containing protein [Bacteriovoracaceae bacterium]|nr:prepilin-type N-terminal cleavage/methylation domain-containing protein [Bacteriovoracaceae bacterium]
MIAENSVEKTESGFTLVELMVVVAIIGILAAIAIPNFKKYQAKSRTSEGKIMLASGYTALESFYQEYNMYCSCFKFSGFIPTGITTAASSRSTTNYYTVGFSATDITSPGAQVVPAGCTADNTFVYFGDRTPAGVASLAANTLTNSIVTNNSSYVIQAQGQIDPDYTTSLSADSWTMSSLKVLDQARSGY